MTNRLWKVTYIGYKLRFFTAEGELVPTPQEAAYQQKQRSDRLAAKLQELGIDPDSI